MQVYGNYSKVKKYAKLFRKWYIKDKLGDCEARLVTWLNHIWNFVKENSVRNFPHICSLGDPSPDAACRGILSPQSHPSQRSQAPVAQRSLSRCEISPESTHSLPLVPSASSKRGSRFLEILVHV